MTQAELNAMILQTLTRIDAKVDAVSAAIADVRVKQGEDSQRIEAVESTLKSVVANEQAHHESQGTILDQTYKELAAKFHSVDKALVATKKQSSAGGAIGGFITALIVKALGLG